MVVGSVSWELALPGCGSLKEKRMVIRSLKDRLRSRFNVSVAETRFHDVHARAEITAAFVTVDGRMAESVRTKIDRFVENDGRFRIVGTRQSSW